MVEAVDIMLTKRRQMLNELRQTLREAQERMKKYAYLRRQPYEFQEVSGCG